MNQSIDDKTLEKLYLAIENGQSVILHSAGGCGKSHILRALATHFANLGKKVCCTATTGIAAINLSVPGVGIAGSTLHSWAGVGLADAPPQKLAARVRHDERARKRWKDTDILIIDEISMAGGEFLDKIDFVGRDIRREKSKPFGGLQIVFSGDFLQLPPVKDKFAFESFAWKEMDISPFILEEPKRYEDINWFQMLLRFRKAEHTSDDIKFLRTRVAAYQDYLKNIDTSLKVVKPTVLYSKKIDVEYQNNQELEKLPGAYKEFPSIDTFQGFNLHAKYDHYMKPLEDVIPKLIYLKVGAQVMLKANLDIEGGLANGSRGVVVELLSDSVKVKWINGLITIVSLHVWMQEDKDGKASRTQIPLILAWALTIHKVQGSTLDYAICDVGPSIFCPGQAYVALSRVRSSDGLLLSDFYPASIKADLTALEYVKSLEGANKCLTTPVKHIKPVKTLIEDVEDFDVNNELPRRRMLKPLVESAVSKVCQKQKKYVLEFIDAVPK
jgi:ATP-dependent DNA helicase PIF1